MFPCDFYPERQECVLTLSGLGGTQKRFEKFIKPIYKNYKTPLVINCGIYRNAITSF